MLPDNRKWMLAAVAILALLRFVGVPLLAWQSNQLDAINQKQSRLTKEQNLAAQVGDLKSATDKLAQYSRNITQHYYRASSVEAFKIKQQRELEALFAKHNVEVKTYNWVDPFPGKPAQLRVYISFAAESANLAAFQLALAKQKKWIEVVEWKSRFKHTSKTSLGHTDGSMLLAQFVLIEQEGV